MIRSALLGGSCHKAIFPLSLGMGLRLGLGANQTGGGGGGGTVPTVWTVQPSITPAPPYADGATLTLNYGTATGATSYSIQFQRDGVDVGSPVVVASGAPAPTRAYVDATDVGKAMTIVVTPINAAGSGTPATSAIRVGLYNDLVYSTIFDQGTNTDPTVLQSYDDPLESESFAITGAATTALRVSGGVLKSYSSGAGTFWTVNTSPLASIKGWVARNPGEDTTTSGRVFICCFADSTNYVTLSTQSNGWSLQKRVGGSFTSLQSFVSPGGAEGDQWELRPDLIGGSVYIKVLRNGNPTTQSAAANDGYGFGPLVSPADDALIAATKCGIGPANWTTALTPPLRNLTAAQIRVAQASAFSFSASTPIISPDDPSKQRTTITGGYSGSITAAEYLVVDSDGHAVGTWTAAPALAGGLLNFDIDTAYGGGGTGAVYLRDPSILSTAASQPVNWLVMQSVFPMLLGMNSDYINQWAPDDSLVDRADRAEWRNTAYNYILKPNSLATGSNIQSSLTGLGGTVKMDNAGYIGANSVGLATYRFLFPFFIAEAGAYTLRILKPDGSVATGVTAALSGDGTSKSYSAGVGSVTFAAGEYSSGFICDVTVSTIPVEGIRAELKRAGDTADTFTDLAAANYNTVCSVVRPMTPRGTNNFEMPLKNTLTSIGTLTLAERWTGPGGPMPVEREVKLANRTGAALWSNAPAVADDDVIQFEAAYRATNLTTGRTYSELSNEVWNDLFDGAAQARILGLRRGYGPDTPGAAETIIDGRTLVSPYTGITSSAFVAGDKIYFDIYGTGYLVYNCVSNVASGVTITTNPAFSLRYTNTQSLRAAKRWYSQRSVEMWAIEDAEYVSRGKPAPYHVVGWQATTLSSAQEILDFNNNYQHIDRFAIAPYWGGGVGGKEMGSFTSTSVTGWGEVNKVKAYTNMAACLDDFFAAAPSAIDAAIGVAQTYKHALAAYLVGKGADPDQIRLVAYEIFHHIIPDEWPDMCGSYAAGTTYGNKAFVYNPADQKTYRSLAASNVGNTPASSPAWWVVYNDGTSLWDAAFTATQRNANPRPVQQLFNAFMTDSRMYDMVTYMCEQWQEKIGDVMTFFSRTSKLQSGTTAIGSALGTIQGWGSQETEVDNVITGGSPNYRYKALADFKATL